MDTTEIEQRIKSAIEDARVHIEDLTGGGDHFRVEVVSAAFRGVSTLQRHRMVQASLKDILGGRLHAIALSTKTPEEAA